MLDYKDIITKHYALGMSGTDHLDMTSVIRDLALGGGNYENLRHFFYSAAWSLDVLRHRWYAVVRDSGLVYTVSLHSKR